MRAEQFAPYVELENGRIKFKHYKHLKNKSNEYNSNNRNRGNEFGRLHFLCMDDPPR